MKQTHQVALVTGGAMGMGAACCDRLARSGLAIAVLDIDGDRAQAVAQRICNGGGRAVAVTADVTDREAIDQALAQVRQQLGAVKVLVNSAGLEGYAPFQEIGSDHWGRIVDINLTGAYNVIQAVLPDMLSLQWGRIVNFASLAAQIGAAHMVHYAAAKGGIVAMTRSLAQEVGAHGITVNAVAPGLIDTPMARRAIDGGKFPVAVEEMVKAYPIPRMGRPEDAAAAVAFFASEEASYITGQLLGINGGTAP